MKHNECTIKHENSSGNKAPDLKVAYFSMEIALDKEIPNYAGGLGVLAADILMSCADLNMSVAGVSLMYHQDDNPHKAFDAKKFFSLRPETCEVRIEDRKVKVGVWEYIIIGKNGHNVPLYMLTTNFPENQKWDRDLTKNLYPSNGYTRLAQEAILGIGGYRILEEIGHRNIDYYHMNEGHSALLTLEALRHNCYNEQSTKEECTFTTHTPVAAGHDSFDYDLAYQTVGKILPMNIRELAGKERLNMTELALNLAKKSNSVAKKHQEVCEKMFPGRKFLNVTNGIYHPRWVSKAMENLFNECLPDWQNNPEVFTKAKTDIPDEKLLIARKEAKKELVDFINTGKGFLPFEEVDADDLFQEDVLTIGFARRFVPYKRPDLVFQHIERLRKLGHRKLQIVFSGRCHPDDMYCNNLMHSMQEYAHKLRGQIRVAIIPNYNLDIGKRLVTGCDVWLNNPVPPMEASGTSGMKAAMNGILNLSLLDGWWIEGFHMQPKAGWGFGGTGVEGKHPADQNKDDVEELYNNLVEVIDCYYNHKDDWMSRMKMAITLAAYFNTHRCVREYEDKVWN